MANDLKIYRMKTTINLEVKERKKNKEKFSQNDEEIASNSKP